MSKLQKNIDMQDFVQNFINDVAVELTDEFDQNFERKAFFTDKWPSTKLHNSRGSMMARNNNLRNSIKYDIVGEQITWSSSLPYASIHNEGGEITVTEKMKRFFWAMYYKAAGAVSKSIERADGRILFVSTDSKEKMKKQAKSKSQRAERMNKEAQQWKALALMKVGQKIKIDKRQFIGDHPQVRQAVETVWNDSFPDFKNYINQIIKK